MKLTYLVDSFDQKKHLFPYDLFEANILNTAALELFLFTNHTIKHKRYN